MEQKKVKTQWLSRRRPRNQGKGNGRFGKQESEVEFFFQTFEKLNLLSNRGFLNENVFLNLHSKIRTQSYKIYISFITILI